MSGKQDDPSGGMSIIPRKDGGCLGQGGGREEVAKVAEFLTRFKGGKSQGRSEERWPGVGLRGSLGAVALDGEGGGCRRSRSEAGA